MNMVPKMRASPGRVVLEALEGRLFLSGTDLGPTGLPQAAPPPPLAAPLDGPVPAAATHFSVTAPANVTAGTAFAFSVAARDVANSIDTTYSGTVHFTSTDGQAVLPANVTLTNGVGSFSATLKTAGNQKITATDTANGSITGQSGSISVSAAAATHYVVSAPSSATAGSAFSFTVTAQDQFNNTATGYGGTVHFTSSDANATLPSNSVLVNGTGTFSATLRTAGNQTITATDTLSPSITGTSNSINVLSAAATHFGVSAPASATAGSAFSVTVTALDQFNNKATGYGGTVHFTSSDGAAVLPANSTLVNGAGTFSATLRTAGPRTITATDTANGSVTGTSGGITVIPAAATHFQVNVPSPATAGTGVNVSVIALDQFNNTATGYSGTVHFTSSDGSATLPANTALSGAVGLFSATLRTAGNQVISVTDTVSSSITGTSSSISVTAAAATHFAVSAPSSATAGTAFSFTVTAQDQFNNTATGYGGTVHFTSGDANATLPSNSTLTNGTGTFSATLRTAGSETISATDTFSPSITGTNSSTNVVAAAATHFSVSAPASATAGSAFNFTVTALDQFSNKATGYSGTVHFTSSDGAAVLPANSTLTNGTGTFSSTLKTAGPRTITATDTANGSITGSTAVTVNPAAATHFALAAPANAIAGTAFTFTVTALDQFNNTATGYAGTVHFTSSDGNAVLPADATLTNGTKAFSATLKTAGIRTLTATDTVSPSVTGTSSTILVDPAAATHFFVGAPASANAGSMFGLGLTALDPFNNRATGYTGTVHFTSSDGNAVLPADATLTNGSKAFAATLKTAGNHTITATDTANPAVTGTSSAIRVLAGLPTHFGVSAPAVVLANGSFSFTATALDQFDNTAPIYSGTVHFTSSDGAAVLPANSTLTNGAATFVATLKTAGSRTITATDTANASITGSSAIQVQAAKANVSVVTLRYGASAAVALQTATDGLRLLPAGRTTSIPFANAAVVQVTLNQAAVLAGGDVSVFGIVGGDYGPIALSGSGTQFTLTFAKAPAAGDRLTLTIGNGTINTYVRRLDALPGDANDDGAVDFNDLVPLAQHYNGPAGAANAAAAAGDFNGDGTVDFNDLVTLAQGYNSLIPPVPAPPVPAASQSLASVLATTANLATGVKRPSVARKGIARR